MPINHKYCLYEVMYINYDDLEKIKEIEKQKIIEEMEKIVGVEKIKKLKEISDITKTFSEISNRKDVIVQDIINTCLDGIRFLDILVDK